jgi:DNA-directed RNA polymerase specialized sigma24 family protein
VLTSLFALRSRGISQTRCGNAATADEPGGPASAPDAGIPQRFAHPGGNGVTDAGDSTGDHGDYRYAAARLGPVVEAEDAASQVFAEAWEHAATLEERGLPVRAWLFGIARNVVNGHRRRWLQRPPALALEDHDAGVSDPALESDRIDLARAIGEPDGGWAEVVTLRFGHGRSLQETAGVLGLSLDAAKGRQARACGSSPKARPPSGADASSAVAIRRPRCLGHRGFHGTVSRREWSGHSARVQSRRSF